jgi:hypothetical protein
MPFIASDLKFFSEFAEMGLGVVCSRSPQAFSNALRTLDAGYLQFRKNVELFAPVITWDRVAENHIDYFTSLLPPAAAATTTTAKPIHDPSRQGSATA